MPIMPFETLPDDARVWVFGSDRPLDDNAAARLLAEVDRFLAHWHAHGHPLSSARAWQDDRFLTVAVDQRTAGASGCSIDGLYRALRALESALGVQMLGGGGIFYRDASGTVAYASRAEFAQLAAAGAVDLDTHVFDLSVDSLGAWRERFEAPAHAGWHARLVANARPSPGV